MSTYVVNTEPILDDLASTAMVRLGLQLLNPFGPEDAASPGPVDEIAGAVLIIGGLAWKFSDELGDFLMENYSLPYGSVSSYPFQSAVTSTTGHSVRTPAKKQMRSTSQSYSRRRYYYGKKRKY